MTKRKTYRPPGWERQPVTWSYSVAFKKPRGKRLVWIGTEAQDVAQASREAQAVIDEHRPDEGLREYGTSPTFWRHWGGYSEPITQDEYDFAQERAQALAYYRRSRTAKEARRHAQEDGVRLRDAAWESAFWDWDGKYGRARREG